MTPLRRQMLDAMCQRGFSPRTQQSYIYAARSLAAYFGRSPARLSM
ncbi:integrase, partial [Ectothiorhodospira shaposhnikovii]|nr:integrase [Ectothiorhodospira shaposhnikovii]MBK1673594.1 integrase [Ectothiorhodospira shaposhnikovii]MBK1675040.1 integrase [Ectothiorhodospira shaposhnikovii]